MARNSYGVSANRYSSATSMTSSARLAMAYGKGRSGRRDDEMNGVCFMLFSGECCGDFLPVNAPAF